MRANPAPLLAVLVSLLTWISPARGDQVFFRNGSVLQARVLESSGSQFIDLEVEGGIISLPWTEVERVILDLKAEGLEPDPPQILASSALLMEGGSGKILLEKNARERRPVASLTKLMTAVIILERGRLGDWVRVGRKAATTPGSALGLRAGQRVLLKDLLTGMLVKSANDAAVAAAEHMYGSEEGFVKAMNEKARSLGLSDTHFRNCHGLDHPDHRSSAYDMALLSRYAMSLPFLADCVRNREVAIWLEEAEGVSRPKVYHNPNQFLGFFLGADGVKTGYTREAGRCLVASAWRGNCRMFAVLLDDQERWRDACELLEYGFSLFRQQRIRDLAPAGRWGPEEGEPGG